jgi:predicted acetyltransferase
MELELRAVTEEEHPAYARTVEAAFGEVADDDEIARWRSVTPLDRTIGVFDGSGVVGTAGVFPFDLTLPGGTETAAAGVTAVAVLPTHRRRGLLRRMMDHQLDDIAERGEAVAILTASETVLYGRYGYGLAASYSGWTLPTLGTELARPSQAPGRVRVIDAGEARTVLPEVYERSRHRHPGQVSQDQAWWDLFLADRPGDRQGRSALFFALHKDADGTPDGIVAYRRKDGHDHGLPDSEIHVRPHLFAVDDEVEVALWELLIGTDLVRRVSAFGRPVEEVLRWRLADPRRLQIRAVTDHLWLRVVDVAAALEARRYPVEGRVVLDLTDPFRPANDGRWSLEGGPDGASAARTTEEADLALGIDDLGALYLGGVTATTLARAGRVEERRPGALARTDAVLASPVVPWCAIEF